MCTPLEGRGIGNVNYDHLQSLRLLREANVKEQAVVSACSVTLITVTHDTVERADTRKL